MTLPTNGTCLAFDAESRQPLSQPLKTLQEVLSWKASSQPSLCSQYATAKSFVRPSSARTKPYTLVCHDFKGGYLEDRYLQGGVKKDAYYFCRWECIDIFIYFSHHFVTVPPVGWICAAHKHGTMMLGTIITEWGDGAALWSTVLSCKDTMQQLVATLVEICHYHGFDGWLVNVENKIEENQVSELREFVEQLTKACHARVPGSKVLWYDSVTRTGDLKWQDQLNEENSQYFDACDGIFLNYCWTPEKLAASRDRAVQKGRPFDVFVGIDVFGRGCPGGGGFNTREALEHAREYKLSAAIFAPGWVLENLGVTDFDDNDCRFWTKLHDLCQPSADSTLPLSSAFCQGHGDAFFCMGQDKTGRPWYNMSLQQRQPERCQVYGFQDPSQMATRPSLNTCLSSAYLGGCSVELSAHLTRPLQTVMFRLFRVRAKLDEALYCSFTYKENSDVPCDVYLVLTFGSGLLTRRACHGVYGQRSTGPRRKALL
ncbi:cytosolic endo-beta-N-acetylglucosaminidase-like [Babylonia areolata]|uniref:cytosolic endo-beta-N-acetylglucosaminidase-like n=1 Tax=Babylonia areolata TaxID=304850 RepID=UPI003FD0D502